MPGRVLKVNADGSVEVRVHISGASHCIQMPRSMTRVPISVSNSPLPCGTRVLARASKSVSGLAYGSKWSNGRYKLGTIIAHSKSEKGFYVYTVAEEDGGEVIKNLRSHEMKVSTHSRLRRFGSMLSGNYGAKDDVVIAEVSQAFPSLDMGRTGKPGRIIPKDIMESEMNNVAFRNSMVSESEVKMALQKQVIVQLLQKVLVLMMANHVKVLLLWPLRSLAIEKHMKQVLMPS